METDVRLDALKGCRILILEENAEVAELLAGMVSSFGCEVLGPVEQIDDAMELIAGETVDAAILDVSIKGEISFAVADELRRRGTPYAFASGNKTLASIERHAPVSIVTKPYAQTYIFQLLCELIDEAN